MIITAKAAVGSQWTVVIKCSLLKVNSDKSPALNSRVFLCIGEIGQISEIEPILKQ
jgi:hypothetical protein